MWEIWVRSLGWEDSLEKEMAIHSSTLAWKIPWMEELGAGYCPWGRKESGMTERLHFLFTFSFSIIPSKEIPGLISFRMHWLDLLAGQGTLKNLLQHHSSKASILRCSAFFIVQLSHPYTTTGKTIALTRQTFVGKAIVLVLIIHGKQL